MATGVKNQQILDLINHSLAHFKNRRKFETYFDLQSYPVADHWFAEDRYGVQNGNRIEWRIMPDPGNGSFKFVHKMETTDRPYRNVMQKQSAEWCYAECKAVYEARTMKEMRGESELYDYLEAIFFDALQDALDGIERSAFNVPDSSGDDKTPLGVPFWINPLNTGTTDPDGQFGGQTATYGDASTTTAVGGLSTQTFTKHRNWAFTHSGINMITMDALRRAMEFTKFQPPRNVKQYYTQPTARFAIYTGIGLKCDYERLVNAGPDNRNGDLNPFSAAGLTFRGADWVAVPVLDEQSGNPIYGIDRNNFKPVVHEAWWFTETEPMNDQDNPHLYTVQWDFQYNYILENKRRGCFVGANAA